MTAWPIEYGDDVDPVPDEWAEDLAIQMLWSLSGRQFGVFPATARPCPHHRPWHYRTGSYVRTFLRYPYGGGWADAPCGCYGHCERTGPRVVHLPGPVQEITAVTIGTDVLDPGGYQLEGDVLYRVGALWPAQDLGRPVGEHGTWSVDYQRGQPVPAGVAQLTGLLAVEMANAVAGGKCRLPRNTTAVNRQGVSYTMYDPQKIYAAGKTGLPEIDAWLAAVNPNALQQPPSVR